MKNQFYLFFVLFLFFGCSQDDKLENANTINSDIPNFWAAYDKITSTTDSTQQMEYLQTLFLDKGTPGLKAFMEIKNYTPERYLNAINSYPKFWASIRENTYKTDQYSKEIQAEVEKLKTIYPDLKPAKIYFTIGALMSGGTTMDSLVLIGAEIAMGDSSVITDEFPDRLQTSLRAHFDTNPINDVVLLNTHEYVHTQQRPQMGYDLLSQCVVEGVAEFVSVTSSGMPSTTPAIAFGQKNDKSVKARFEKEVGGPHWNDWLYNDFQNIFLMRDLGYYIGYAICESYYNRAADKKQAIKDLIELNYSDPAAVELLVDKSRYLGQPVAALKIAYENARPTVTRIVEFENGSQDVDPSITQITVEFSEPLSTRFRNQRLGPLGADFVLPMRSINFGPDAKSMVFGVELEPNKQYQLQLSDEYRNLEGRVLIPYLIDFKTGN
ncbi:MAG: hypothetical protein AAFO07_15045 [Bacteroidota bacterium]